MIGGIRGSMCLCLGLVLCAQAQELDTAIHSSGRTQSSVLDQIANPSERKAFLQLYREHKPAARRSLAEKFLSDYPASWLLAQVYEIAAKACLDLDDAECALDMGARSLRLLPENPLLLVPLAGVQFQRGRLEDARESALQAIDLLDRFAAPAARELSTSSYYLLGRIYSMQGLAASGDKRTPLLEQARDALDHAILLSPKNPDLAYLRGLVLLSLARFAEASLDFRFAAERRGPFQEKARSQVEKLNGLALIARDAKTARVKAVGNRPTPPPALDEYAGSNACQKCHRSEYDGWERTGMALMLRPYKPENVIGDFVSKAPFIGPDGAPAAYMKIDHNRPVFELRTQENRWRRYPVDYTIGSKWQQAYATRLADGRIQVFPIQYNVLKQQWVNYWERIDPPGSERANLSQFSRMSEAANYQLNCAPCHTSQLRAGPGNDWTRATFLAGGINCEMCHGPSASHAAAMAVGQAPQKRPKDPPVDFLRINNRDAVQICAQCHMQSAIRGPGPEGESEYRDGEFFPRYRQRPYNEFLRKAFYKDGRFRETTFIVEAFERSKCFRIGQAQCGNCHDPHLAGQGASHTSLKFAAAPDEMCLQCHAEYRANPERHTRHRADSEGSRCVSCHMPRIMNSLLFRSRGHQIDDVPDATLTLRFGQEESPNACLECHSSRNATWVQSQLTLWDEKASPRKSNATP